MGDHESLEEYLKAAQPRLVIRVVRGTGLKFKVTPYIKEVEHGCEEVIEEGFDPDHSPLGVPVYWRIIKRGDERLYCSTHLLRRDQLIRVWGTRGLVYCDPVTGMAVARIETVLPG